MIGVMKYSSLFYFLCFHIVLIMLDLLHVDFELFVPFLVIVGIIVKLIRMLILIVIFLIGILRVVLWFHQFFVYSARVLFCVLLIIV